VLFGRREQLAGCGTDLFAAAADVGDERAQVRQRVPERLGEHREAGVRRVVVGQVDGEVAFGGLRERT